MSASQSIRRNAANDGFESWTTPTEIAAPTGAIVEWAARVAPTSWLLCDGSAVSRSTYSALFNVLVPSRGEATMTIATPCVVTLSAHGLITGDAIYFTTTGALPTGLAADTLYYVVYINSSTFNLATSRANAFAGTKINTSGTQSGNHTLYECPWGLGNGSTTFNVPNRVGNVGVGLNTVDTTDFTNIGKTGGEKTHTLVVAEMPAHNHTYYRAPVNSGSLDFTTGSYNTNQVQNTGSTGGDGAHNNIQPYMVFNYIIKT
jgi:microcystin-dependent protein